MLQDAEGEFCTGSADIPRADHSRGLENYTARVIGAEGMGGGRGGGGQAEDRESRPNLLPVPTSDSICLHVIPDLFPAEKPSSIHWGWINHLCHISQNTQ